MAERATALAVAGMPRPLAAVATPSATGVTAVAPSAVHCVAASTSGRRVAFINSGMLGHASVARLLAECAAAMDGVSAAHLDLSADLTLYDRGVRRVLGAALAPAAGPLANVDLRRWRLELNVGLLAARRLAAAERERPFDLLHFHTQAAAYASLGRMQRTPSIVSIDTTQRLARTAVHSRLGQASYAPNIAHDQRVFRAAAAITATSQWAARDLLEHDPLCLGKVHVMPYPVRPIAEPEWLERRYARARQGATPHVLFMGGDFVRKGGDLLLAVWQEASLHEYAVLDLVTDWPLDPRSLPAGVRVHTGVRAYTPAWRQLWEQADLFVMPTRDEAFGMVYQEAAAAGLPAIGTRLNAIPEIVRDGETGLLVTRDDRGELVEAMQTLILSADLRRTFGGQALTTIRAVASFERYTARLHAVMTNAMVRHEQRRA